MKIKKIIVINLAFLLLTLLTPIKAVAVSVDRKIFNGYSCQNGYPGPNTFYFSNGAAYNTSSKQQYLTCAVVRDASKIYSARIQVIDANPLPGQNVSCWLYAVTVTKNILGQIEYKYAKAHASTENITTGFESLTFPMLGLKGDSYYLDCYVPGVYTGKRSGIVSYEITEQN